MHCQIHAPYLLLRKAHSFIHRTKNSKNTWQRISRDLSGKNTCTENAWTRDSQNTTEDNATLLTFHLSMLVATGETTMGDSPEGCDIVAKVKLWTPHFHCGIKSPPFHHTRYIQDTNIIWIYVIFVYLFPSSSTELWNTLCI